jgi:hypothetical protein
MFLSPACYSHVPHGVSANNGPKQNGNLIDYSGPKKKKPPVTYYFYYFILPEELQTCTSISRRKI